MISETLEKADKCINGERQDQYGSPEDSFALIARYWQTYLEWRSGENKINAIDVAIMMSLFKHARMSGQKWHPDNAVDACGYLAILNDRLHHTIDPLEDTNGKA
jgi:hypothetical protein